jgi:ATP-binding cassette subfamily C protein CydC
MARERARLVLGVAAGAAAAAAAVGLMALSGWFISAAAAAGLAPAAAHLFNFFLPSIGVRIFAILRTAARYAERIVSHEATFRILEGLRVWFYVRIEPLAPAGLWRYRSGDILNRIVADIDALDSLYLRVVAPTAVAGMAALTVFFLLAFFDGRIAAAFACLLVPGAGAVSAAAARAAAPAGRLVAESLAEMRSRAVSVLQGIAEIAVFGAAGAQRDVLERCQSALTDAQGRLAGIRAASAAAMHLLSGATVALVLYLGAGLVSEGRLDGAKLALMALAAGAAFETVFGLPAAWLLLGRTRAAGGRLLETLAASPPVGFAEPSRAAPGGCDIAFEKVSFRYLPGRPLALDGIDIAVPEGRRLAVVGGSGAGKSTLAHLVSRFYDPQAGAVRIGGVDLRDLGEADLRRMIGVVSQPAHLFTATLRANLLLAAPDAGEPALRRALAAARLIDFVDGLPEGLDTWIGEAGRRLSAGQARRLAVARVFLKNPPIWVLDEPTEGLDRISEAALVDSLLEATAGRTALWITHRPAGLERMDVVLVMEAGRIADRGTHAELLARNRTYAGWWTAMK